MSRAALRAAGGVLGALAAILAAHTAGKVFEFRFPMPYWDTTTVWAGYLEALETGSLVRLLVGGLQGAGHQAIPPVWIFLLDVALVEGRGTLMIASSVVLLGGCVAMLSWARLRGSRQSLPEALAMVGLLTIPVVSLAHVHLARPIHVMQYAQVAGTLLAFLAAAVIDHRAHRGGRELDGRLLLLLVTGHLWAVFSFGNGLAGWAATLALATLRRWPRRYLLVSGASAAVTWGAFFLASEAVDAGTMERLAALDPATLALHVLGYLGNPLALVLSAVAGEALARFVARTAALAALVAMVWWLVGWWRRPREQRHLFECVAVQIGLYCVGAAILTAVARSHLGADQAFATRYSLHAAWGWSVLAALWAGRVSPRRPLRLLTAGVVLTALFVPAQLDGMRRLRGAQNHLRPAYLALLTGVEDPSVLERIFAPAEVLRGVAERLRPRKLGVLGSDAARWLDHPLRDSFRVDDEPIGGEWEPRVVDTDAAAAIVEGRCACRLESGDWVLLADSEGIVRGLGQRTRLLEPQEGRTRWMAYVSARAPLRGYTAYVVDPVTGTARAHGRR